MKIRTNTATEEGNPVRNALQSVKDVTVNDDASEVPETHSYLERETELEAIRARFASGDTESRSSTPRSSKFTEDFNKRNSTATSKRKSLGFLRLPNFGLKTYDGTNTTEDLLAVPMPQFNMSDDTTRNAESSTPLGDVNDMSTQWGKAVAANDARDKVGIERVKSAHGRSSNPLLAEIQRSKEKKMDKKGGQAMTAAQQYEKRFKERLAVKEMAMDDWEAEMDAGAQKAKAKSKNILQHKKPTGPDRCFPWSWSRFPSHTREERTASAGEYEQVANHDFAMRMNADSEQVFHQCRETDEGHMHDDHPDWHKYDPKPVGVMERLEDQVSQTIYKIEVHGGGSKPFEFQTNGRRGSMTIAGKVQYPELELLPITPGFQKPVSRKASARSTTPHAASATKPGTYFDGANDDSDLEESMISIADPDFYKDCLVEMTESRFNTPAKQLASLPVSKTLTRSMTWHGRGSKRGRFHHGRNLSTEDLVLHGSTQDFYEELLEMEKAELTRLLHMVKGG